MKITTGMGGDWDLFGDDGMLVAWWSRGGQCMYSRRPQFRHLDDKPATEAHGLLTLNAIKAQLENDNE